MQKRFLRSIHSRICPKLCTTHNAEFHFAVKNLLKRWTQKLKGAYKAAIQNLSKPLEIDLRLFDSSVLWFMLIPSSVTPILPNIIEYCCSPRLNLSQVQQIIWAVLDETWQDRTYLDY